MQVSPAPHSGSSVFKYLSLGILRNPVVPKLCIILHKISKTILPQSDPTSPYQLPLSAHTKSANSLPTVSATGAGLPCVRTTAVNHPKWRYQGWSQGSWIEMMGVNPKIGVSQTPKMDNLYNGGKPYEQIDNLGGQKKTNFFWFNTHIVCSLLQLSIRWLWAHLQVDGLRRLTGRLHCQWGGLPREALQHGAPKSPICS